MVVKINYKIFGLLFLALASCNEGENQSEKGLVNEVKKESATIAPIVEKQPQTSKFIENVTHKAQQLIVNRQYTPFRTLQSQKMDRMEENSEVSIDTSTPSKMNGNQMYYYLKERTLLIGASYLCDRCPNVHLSNATGYVINEDGVIATNYHVIDVKQGIDISGIFAADSEGNVYPVTKILAASQSNDLAILQVDTNGKKLETIPFAEEELIGETIYLMGHPFSKSFFMSKGIIGRKYISDLDDEVKIAITAEFGQGASGGPVVNENGQLVGMVSGTHMEYTYGSKEHGDLQMIIKEAIPVSVLNNYVTRNDL